MATDAVSWSAEWRRGVVARVEGAGRHPLPQLLALAVIRAGHGERALCEPYPGVQPQPGVQQPGGVASEFDAVGGDPQRVDAAQRWVVTREGLVEIDRHRQRWPDLAVGGVSGYDTSRQRIEHMSEYYC